MTRPADIETVVAKLTEAQRRLLNRLPYPMWLCDWRTIPSLFTRQLVSDYFETRPANGLKSGTWLRLTPLGEQIRAHLLERTQNA